MIRHRQQPSISIPDSPSRVRPIATLVLVLALVASACSSGQTVDVGANNTSDAPTTSSAPPVADPPDLEKPVVVVPDGEAPTELEIDDLIEGDGDVARPGDYLTMHYVGVRQSDGGEFDASWNRDQKFNFTLGQGNVIVGWDQGIEGMRVGGRRLLSIPAELAYGTEARGADIPANSALVFVVDLIDVQTPPTVENAPEPVTELEIVVLSEGDGPVIEAGMVVEAHYVAVLQTTGEVFDSSWAAGRPATFGIRADPSQALPAWDEGLVGLRVGDHVRMVIPPELGLGEAGAALVPPDATIITELNIISAR